MTKDENLRIDAVKRQVKKNSTPKVYDIIKKAQNHTDPPKGSEYGKCKICGKTYKEILISEQNRYTNFHMCPSCRNQKANTKSKEVETTIATLPFKPWPWQKKAGAEFETHQYQVIAAANRVGKDRYTTMTGIRYFSEILAENRHVDRPDLVPSVLWWIIAPTDKIALQNWRELKQYMPKQWVVACSNDTMTMQTIGNGIIEVRSAYDPESLVGVGLDLATITEAARIKYLDIVWANVQARLMSPGRGRQKDKKPGNNFGVGKAIINSSPIGKGYFYEMYKFGKPSSDTYSSDWDSYQLTWRENPALNQKADEIVKTKYGEMTFEESLRIQIGERLFRQNYLADFLAMDGTVFKDFEDKCVTNLYSLNLGKEKQTEYIRQWHEPIPYHTYRMGYDPATGSSADTPAVIVRDMDTNRIVQVVDLYGKNYDEQWDEIAYLSKRYNYAPCVWLRTGHTAIENQLAKRGVIEIPLDEQGGKKAQYIQSLERAIQNDDLHVLADGDKATQTFIFQMEDYTENKGKYANDKQEHDDFVSACYAVYYDYSVAEVKVAYCPLMGSVQREYQ